jgi:pyruvate-formate lyase-activating enzyme
MTADVHSISLTGGEPLTAGDFLIDVASSCKDAGWATYLETNGADKRTMEQVAPYLDFAAIDIKLPDHEATPRTQWPRLYGGEISCLKIALDKGVKSFVKIVVLNSSQIDVFRKVCEKLADVGSLQLVIQPVAPAGKIRTAPLMDQVLKFSETAATSGLREVMIIPQVHKLMGVL